MENVLLENGDRRERRGEGGRGWSAEGEKKTAEGWTSFVVERIKRSQTPGIKKFRFCESLGSDTSIYGRKMHPLLDTSEPSGHGLTVNLPLKMGCSCRRFWRLISPMTLSFIATMFSTIEKFGEWRRIDLLHNYHHHRRYICCEILAHMHRAI